MHQMTADAIADGQKTFECSCCEKPLKNINTIMWVEMSTTNAWYELGAGLPEDQSQGCFPVGATCYRKRDVKKKYL
jgi:hypothetical protein